MISRHTIDEILDRVDIVRVIEERGVTLKRRGASLMGVCPFHGDKGPSLSVSPDRGLWHCFGCGEGGNAIDFVMKCDVLTFVDAVKLLAKELHIDIEDGGETDEERNRRLRMEALWLANERVARHYVDNLHADSPGAAAARSYARNRWGEDYVEEAGMGYARATGDDLVHWARENGERIDLLVELGLLRQSEKDGSLYDFYRDRLVIPIRDRAGHVSGFTCRDLSGKVDSKYLNSSTSEVYDKSSSVFGVNMGWREAMKRGQWLLVEGAPDAMKLQSVGFHNAAASLGGAWTAEQMKLLGRAARAVCFINDADPVPAGELWGTGIQKVMDGGRTAMEAGLSVTVRELTCAAGNEKQDPGSFFTEPEMMHQLKEEDYVTWCARWWMKKARTAPEKVEVRDRVGELLALIRDDSMVQTIVDDLSKVEKGRDRWLAARRRAVERRRQQQAQRKNGDVDWRKYNFFEEYDCYFGKTDKGDVQWSNFTMKPLFHVRDGENTHRLFEVKNNCGRKIFLDLDMADLVSLQRFRKRLEQEGNFIFKGKDEDLMDLKSYLYEMTETADLVKKMGWNSAGEYYAWGNGLWHDGTFLPADKYGIVRVETGDGKDERCYFIPSAQDREGGAEVDSTRFTLEKKFMHNDLNNTPMGEYLAQFVRVWGENGVVGIMYWMTSLFRDVIISATNSFPLLNLFGPKGTGKTTMGSQLMRFFVTADKLPPSLRDMATGAALSAEAGYSVNAMVHFDEYKNDVRPQVVEFLKATYNGIGRTKMGGENFKELVQTPVRSGVIVSGQEMPTSDIALFQRCIFLTFMKDKFSTEDREAMNKLMNMQHFGCTGYTLQLLELRQRVVAGFNGRYNEEVRRIVESDGGSLLETRLVENWAKLLAILRIFEGRIQLPFSYEQAWDICMKFLKKQNSLSGDTNELGHFWRMVMYLRDSGSLIEGSDFHIRSEYRFSGERVKREYMQPRRVLYLKPTRVFQLYQMESRRAGDNSIPTDALREYLKNSEGFLDYIKGMRFLCYDQSGNPVQVRDSQGSWQKKSSVTRAMAFDFEVLSERYGVELESTILYGELEDKKPQEPAKMKQPELPF